MSERAEVLAKVLAEHRQVTGFDEVGDFFKYACACSWTGNGDADHDAHVAAALDAALAAQEGERGGADRDGYWMTPEQVSEAGGVAQVAFGTYQWQEAERDNYRPCCKGQTAAHRCVGHGRPIPHPLTYCNDCDPYHDNPPQGGERGDDGVAAAVEAVLAECRCTLQYPGFDRVPFTSTANCWAHGIHFAGLRKRLAPALADSARALAQRDASVLYAVHARINAQASTVGGALNIILAAARERADRIAGDQP